MAWRGKNFLNSLFKELVENNTWRHAIDSRKISTLPHHLKEIIQMRYSEKTWSSFIANAYRNKWVTIYYFLCDCLEARNYDLDLEQLKMDKQLNHVCLLNFQFELETIEHIFVDDPNYNLLNERSIAFFTNMNGNYFDITLKANLELIKWGSCTNNESQKDSKCKIFP